MTGIMQAVAGGSGNSVPFTFQFSDEGSSSTNAASYSFTLLDIGAADSTRIIAAFVGNIDSDGAEVPTSVTIGGVSATQRASIILSNAALSLWTAAVPTGTTATVDIVYPETQVTCGVALYSFYSLVSAVPTSTTTNSSASGTTLSASRTPTRLQNAVIGGFVVEDTTPTINWTILTEDSDFGPESLQESTASLADAALSVQTPVVTVSGADMSRVMILALWEQ